MCIEDRRPNDMMDDGANNMVDEGGDVLPPPNGNNQGRLFRDTLIMNHFRHLFSGLKKGKARVFYKPTKDVDVLAVVGLGKKDEKYDELNDIDTRKENVRIASGVGVKSLQEVEVTDVRVEDFEDPVASAEGATLATFAFQEFKAEDKRKKIPKVSHYKADEKKWKEGVVLGDSQNTARYLKELPSNLLTPTRFGELASKILSDGGVKVTVHDKAWAESKKMGSFLAVAQGSKEEPKFLEMSYSCGSGLPNIVLVGKGVTFDTGGISIKPSAGMDAMRADMGGAAMVVATMLAISRLKLQLNVIGLCPLTENMPGGAAIKPGDVVRASNGKSICIDNTDAEGRLILADALCYASTFNPCFTLDAATLTGAMKVALGAAATGCFTNSTKRFKQIQKAGTRTGDRIWRMPLYEAYTNRVTGFPAFDVHNVGQGSNKGGGACTAAAFLKEFAPPGDWMHLDIAGVMDVDPFHGMPYLGGSGMSGRPTRTVVEFLKGFQAEK
ncbi:hypothetical protein GE061_006488 [Apolygus lucorum]|uniref:Cytosol aminopeptidase n=1 Tax=Apolygus lucorum TaxID=248454 RepID=A0A8S9WWL4_APOLU|nr:hypothetical protein GE061_006488 [Apolygus lucorum]